MLYNELNLKGKSILVTVMLAAEILSLSAIAYPMSKILPQWGGFGRWLIISFLISLFISIVARAILNQERTDASKADIRELMERLIKTVSIRGVIGALLLLGWMLW